MLLNNLFKYWTYQIFAPGTVVRAKYEAFKSLLEVDKQAHEQMAALEEIYYRQIPVDFTVIESKYDSFSQSVADIVANLAKVCSTRYADLQRHCQRFNAS